MNDTLNAISDTKNLWRAVVILMVISCGMWFYTGLRVSSNQVAIDEGRDILRARQESFDMMLKADVKTLANQEKIMDTQKKIIELLTKKE